ncbi:hypothetical protein FACS189461_1400 [Spirochaetia bacterium]|nr:hypothetical protein FACS189461_1400 [Spirochaetia bacterium]
MDKKVKEVEERIRELKAKFDAYQRTEPSEAELMLSRRFSVPFFYWLMGYEAGCKEMGEIVETDNL